jgi:hypothetical protein
MRASSKESGDHLRCLIRKHIYDTSPKAWWSGYPDSSKSHLPSKKCDAEVSQKRNSLYASVEAFEGPPVVFENKVYSYLNPMVARWARHHVSPVK